MTDAPSASIVVPTFNERGSIVELLAALNGVAESHAPGLEVLIVDDRSPDGTAELARAEARRLGAPEGRFRVLDRDGPRGLSPAVAFGFASARGGILGVCDADGSHDLGILPRMLELVGSGGWDVAVGSRYVPGGGAEAAWPLRRRLASRLAALAARPLTPVRDPMAGFFVARRAVVERSRLSGKGYKILLEILVRGSPESVAEVPYVFRDRRSGESKLGLGVVARDLAQLMRLYLWRLRHPTARTRRWGCQPRD